MVRGVLEGVELGLQVLSMGYGGGELGFQLRDLGLQLGFVRLLQAVLQMEADRAAEKCEEDHVETLPDRPARNWWHGWRDGVGVGVGVGVGGRWTVDDGNEMLGGGSCDRDRRAVGWDRKDCKGSFDWLNYTFFRSVRFSNANTFW